MKQNGFIAFCSGERFSLYLTATATLTKKSPCLDRDRFNIEKKSIPTFEKCCQKVLLLFV